MPGFYLLFAISLVLAAPPARAQSEAAPSPMPCFSYREVARQLKGTYQEAPISLGLQANGNLLQVFSSPQSGTWTIVSTSPDGQACILAAGRDWQVLRSIGLDQAV